MPLFLASQSAFMVEIVLIFCYLHSILRKTSNNSIRFHQAALQLRKLASEDYLPLLTSSWQKAKYQLVIYHLTLLSLVRRHSTTVSSKANISVHALPTVSFAETANLENEQRSRARGSDAFFCPRTNETASLTQVTLHVNRGNRVNICENSSAFVFDRYPNGFDCM